MVLSGGQILVQCLLTQISSSNLDLHYISTFMFKTNDNPKVQTKVAQQKLPSEEDGLKHLIGHKSLQRKL